MIQSGCKYNPMHDVGRVSQTGSIDLQKSFVNMCVPSTLPDSETAYNGIEDPGAIFGRPRDVFELVEMASHINNYTPPEKEDSASS